ncbi:glycosyltransferase [uncultured Microbulbifer sp.]|uniref:glycosyltransferase n=1 Tax=uncultured Microbulbifer sp. TaxID=348147 RepID=UPI00262E52A5|nr:glycosyltransferase [uncultured Microbulbifer sp.]
MKNKQYSIVIVPDRFAHYRYASFKLISSLRMKSHKITIYADPREDPSKIPIVPDTFCNMYFSSGGIFWKKIKSYYIRNVCFWQTELLSLGLSKDVDAVVYWGEAHRISTWLSAILSRITGKKVVFWTHGIYGRESKVKLIFRLLFYNLANSLLLYGRHGKQQLEAAGISKKMYVINNALDVRKQAQYVDSLENSQLHNLRNIYCTENDRLLVFAGRLERKKRLDLLLAAISNIKSSGEAIKLIVIGDGGERDKLEVLTKAFHLEKDVFFLGPKYNDQVVLQFLRIADLCVSPGEVGLTAMHALICGTPVISHSDLTKQMPEVESIRSGISGFLFERNNVNCLVNKIQVCFSAIDSGIITFGSCRRVVMKFYTPEYQCKVFYRAIENLL